MSYSSTVSAILVPLVAICFLCLILRILVRTMRVRRANALALQQARQRVQMNQNGNRGTGIQLPNGAGPVMGQPQWQGNPMLLGMTNTPRTGQMPALGIPANGQGQIDPQQVLGLMLLRDVLGNMRQTQTQTAPALNIDHYTNHVKIDPASHGAECPICMVDHTFGEDGRVLPCLHVFHEDCIEKWLKTKASCPLCQTPLTAGDDVYGGYVPSPTSDADRNTTPPVQTSPGGAEPTNVGERLGESLSLEMDVLGSPASHAPTAPPTPANGTAIGYTPAVPLPPPLNSQPSGLILTPPAAQPVAA